MNFIGLLAALGTGDADRAAQAVLSFGGKPTKNDDFVEDLKEFFSASCKGYGNNVDVGEVLRGILKLVRKHKIRVNANYATLVVNALCIESMAKKVVPTYNVLDAGRPLLSSYQKILCYKPESKLRQVTYKAWLPIAYFVKIQRDKQFFRKLRKSQEEDKAGGNNISTKRRALLRRARKIAGISLATLSMTFACLRFAPGGDSTMPAQISVGRRKIAEKSNKKALKKYT